ncbi:MAG: type II secretion system F family protein [Bacteriovoracaceae bacterium]|nr:type II secretion system F family protein [Bacteriovoracaceae bacterium]
MLFYASIILMGIAVFIIANIFLVDEVKYKTTEVLEEVQSDNKNAAAGFVLKYSRPFFRRYVSPMVSTMKNKKEIREKYKQKLAASGLYKELSSDDFFAFKLFLILGFPVMFLVVRTFLEESWSLWLVPITSVVGFFYPDFWIKGKIQKRQQNILHNMPFMVDMLALSVEAGLDFMAAISRVIDKAPKSSLVEEFETLIKEIKIGSSRAEALRNMAWRIDLLPVSSFCATLIAADSVGANIGPILKDLSVEIRQKRSAEAEKAGATAATKILFPMIFLILPAVVIIIMAPIIFQFIGV